jgi:hypothetical protein
MKADRDRLLTEGINLATRSIEEQGIQMPFALALQGDGSLIRVEAEEQPLCADELIALLCGELQHMAREGSIKASAIVSDVNLFDKLTNRRDDAIRVELDDVDSSPITCYVPYAVHDRVVTPDQVIAVGGGTTIFDP